jgi:D-alanyl-D-alanine carboxypeptidase
MVIVLAITLCAVCVVDISVFYARTRTSSSGGKYQAAIEEIVHEHMEEDAVPGAIVGVWIPDRGSWILAEGVSSMESGTPIRPSDKVRIASVTKTFVVTVLLQLLDEGKLSLSDTLDTYFPRMPYAGSITVRQLLNHTSGLSNFGSYDEFKNATAADPLRRWEPEELVAIATSHPLEFQPGEAYHYSNTNTVLSGMIVEKITSNTVASEVKRRILDPLGLDNTYYIEGPEQPAGLIPGYVYDSSRRALRDLGPLDPSMGGAALAMVSNLVDLKTWAEALATGKFLSPEAQKERTTFVDTSPGDSVVQQGLGLIKKGQFVGHEGIALGFQTEMYYLPSRHATFVVILNRSPSKSFTADKLLKDLVELFYPGEATW